MANHVPFVKAAAALSWLSNIDWKDFLVADQKVLIGGRAQYY